MLALSALGTALCAAAPARADFRLCNLTCDRISVSLAYTDGSRMGQRGLVEPEAARICDTLLRGALAAEFYYVYAMDERGGEWKGKAFMCTPAIASSRSTARQDCFARGLRAHGLLRGRHRQGREELDRAADRPGDRLTESNRHAKSWHRWTRTRRLAPHVFGR